MRRKFFAEHGALRIMALLRFPTIHTLERNVQLRETDMSYINFAGDSALMAAEPPRELFRSQWFREAEGTSDVLGFAPFGQEHRYQASNVHRAYQTLDGFSFIDSAIDTKDKAWYIAADEYDEVFQTLQLRHWQSHCRIGFNVARVVPGGRTSLYAGA